MRFSVVHSTANLLCALFQLLLTQICNQPITLHRSMALDVKTWSRRPAEVQAKHVEP